MTAKSSIINFEMTNFSEKSLLTTQRLIELVDQRDDQDALRKIGGLNGILEKLSSSIDGIPSHTIENRREVWGSNMMPKESPITFLDLLKNAFSDKTIILLVIAAVISIIVGTTTRDPTSGEYHPEEGWIEGFAIVVSIVIVVMATTINDYKKEQKFQKLTELGERTDIVVLRDGVEVTIDIAELVVGDICMISSGLVIPADGLFVKGQSVVVDESSATGENDPKKKNTTAPFFLSSTTVNTAENAWMLVICVGVNSFGGRLLNATGACGEIRATPLQDKLNDMAEMIGKVGLVTAVVLFCCLSVIEVFQFAWKSNDAHASDFLKYFIIAVSVVVVAVPEGLPLAVTIALAYSQSQMMADNNQVRRLVACETMGNSTQICSDKTGTLTQNLMSVKQVFICEKHVRISDPCADLEPIDFPALPSQLTKLLCESISLNSTSSKVLQNGEWIWRNDMGNKTENGMLDFVDRVALSEMSGAMLPHQILRERAPHRFLYPFTSERKRMSVLIRSKMNELMWSTFYVKGASEKILELCTHYYDSNGKVEPLASHARNEISEYITRYAKDANRTIGVAVADGLQITDLEPEEPSGIPLTWIGVLGIQDPLRPGVPEAVQKCQGAGVTVRMCTGDNLETAIAISRECGIYDEQKGHIALTGAAFRDIVYRKDKSPYKEQRELERTLENMTVLARSQPLDKQLLVLMLMMQGEVVAVTGDGTNDAPALKLANVGFVMKSGTDIAVRSADIVLLDNNFRSVERAVVWGRTVNDNIRKFLQFQLCVNIVCVGLTFIGSLTAEGHFPIESVQLLWVNLMMDTLAALALATELPNEACLNRGPIPRKAPVISRRMWRFIICHAAYQLIITILLLHNAHVWFNIRPEKIIVNGMEAQKLKFNREHLTVVFNVFVFAIIFNEFNARLLYDETNIFSGLKRSLWFIAIIIIMIVVQVLAVQVGGDFMKTKPLSTELWIVSILFGLGSWLFGYLFRYIPINEPEYEKVFDEDELDDDARALYDSLQSTIRAANSNPSSPGLLRFQKASSNVVKSLRVISLVRRSLIDRDLRSSTAYRRFVHFKEQHPSVF